LSTPGVAHGDAATTTTTTTTKNGAAAKTPGAAREDYLRNALAPLVKDGTITQAQADKVIQALENARPDHPFAGKHFAGPRMMFGDIFGAAAKKLGMSTDDLRAAMRDGKSIADIAKEKKVDPAAVVDAMVNATKTKVDQAVKDGKLTQAQADERLKTLREHLTALVNGDFPHPQAGARHGFGGRWKGGEGEDQNSATS
jgi:hypothetical protein